MRCREGLAQELLPACFSSCQFSHPSHTLGCGTRHIEGPRQCPGQRAPSSSLERTSHSWLVFVSVSCLSIQLPCLALECNF